MKKTLISVLLMLALFMGVEEVLGEAAGQPAAEHETAATADPFAAEREAAIAAVLASVHGAEVDYALRDRDDGRYEWNVFFRQSGVLGVAKVLETGSEVRKVEVFNQSRDTSMTASEAIAKLAQAKGEMTIVDLDLDWDDGRLGYEGEAELNGKRYEFEITTDGVIVEWERD